MRKKCEVGNCIAVAEFNLERKRYGKVVDDMDVCWNHQVQFCKVAEWAVANEIREQPSSVEDRDKLIQCDSCGHWFAQGNGSSPCCGQAPYVEAVEHE